MEIITLYVVPKPEKGATAIHLRSKNRPFFMGSGSIRYVGGGCSMTLADGVNPSEPMQWTMQCPNCKSYVRLSVKDGGAREGDCSPIAEDRL
jgi:hypothetical protein